MKVEIVELSNARQAYMGCLNLLDQCERDMLKAAGSHKDSQDPEIAGLARELLSLLGRSPEAERDDSFAG